MRRGIAAAPRAFFPLVTTVRYTVETSAEPAAPEGSGTGLAVWQQDRLRYFEWHRKEGGCYVGQRLSTDLLASSRAGSHHSLPCEEHQKLHLSSAFGHLVVSI